MAYTVFYSTPGGPCWGPPPVAPPNAKVARVSLDPKRRAQTILGFGGAFTESTAYLFSLLPHETQEKFLQDYFDCETGLGYTMGRVSIHSNDFSLASYVYTKGEDTQAETFSLQHDEQWLIPLLQRAKARSRQLQLLASPWSPPAWMKTNGCMLRGGRLRSECRAAWACYIDRYLTEMERRGLPIRFLTVQNEPEALQTWESCLYTPQEEVELIADFIGPMLRRHHPQVRLLGWDHNRNGLEAWADALSDAPSAPYIWGMAYHWYVSDDHEAVARVRRAHSELHLLFSEGCLEGGPQPDSWEPARKYARNYLHDLNNGCEGFLDWNLLLDCVGGPNHLGNFCHAPILADTVSGTIKKNSAYYAIGHFSRVIRAGAVRIGADSDEVVATAVQNPDGSRACVLLNDASTPCGVQIVCGEVSTRVIWMEPYSLASCVFTV